MPVTKETLLRLSKSMRGYNIFLGLFTVTAVVAATCVSVSWAQEEQGSDSLPLTAGVQQIPNRTSSFQTNLEMSDFGQGSMFGNPENAVPVAVSSAAGVSSSEAQPRLLYRPFNRSRRCRINSVLNDIEERYLFCGDEGVTFPVLISGDCPVSACILDAQTDNQKLGPIFTDK